MLCECLVISFQMVRLLDL